jgi:hypothetical protein
MHATLGQRVIVPRRAFAPCLPRSATVRTASRRATPDRERQQPSGHPASVPAWAMRVPAQGSRSEDTELLWAGYSDLSEQLQRLQRRHDSLEEEAARLQRQLAASAAASPLGAWQAASSLALFVLCVNVAGLLAHVHAGFFLPPWVAKPAYAVAVKSVLALALPLTNTTVVLIFCLQALKAAWKCLRW